VRTRSFGGDTKIIVDTFAAINTPTNVAGLPKDLEI